MNKDLSSIGVEPILRESVAEKVVQRVLGLVKAGNLKPGDKLPSEKELMVIFSVSRPTLREALRALSILGVTTTRKGDGSYVSELKAKDLLRPLEFFVSIEENSLDDIFECRQLLECEMVRKADLKVTDAEIAEFQSLINIQKREVEDPLAFRISDQQFHELLATVSGNPVLARVADGMYNMGMEARRRATDIDGVIAQSIEDHQKIVDALRQHDPDRAAKAMNIHLTNIKKSTEQIITRKIL